jgi:hypothetical protein
VGNLVVSEQFCKGDTVRRPCFPSLESWGSRSCAFFWAIRKLGMRVRTFAVLGFLSKQSSIFPNHRLGVESSPCLLSQARQAAKGARVPGSGAHKGVCFSDEFLYRGRRIFVSPSQFGGDDAICCPSSILHSEAGDANRSGPGAGCIRPQGCL